MRLILSIFMMALLFPYSEAFAAPNCWQGEIDPHTNKIFASATEYQKALIDWQKVRPSLPGPYDILVGWQTGTTASQETNQFNNDKMKHCYVGCRIAQETNLGTTSYAAWRKEKSDLTDCDPETHFELADYLATVHGGAYGKHSQGVNACINSCSNEFEKD